MGTLYVLWEYCMCYENTVYVLGACTCDVNTVCVIGTLYVLCEHCIVMGTLYVPWKHFICDGTGDRSSHRRRTEGRWGKPCDRLCPQTSPMIWGEKYRVGSLSSVYKVFWAESASGIFRPEPPGHVFCGLPRTQGERADTPVVRVFSQKRAMQTLVQGFVSGHFKEAGRGPWRKEAIVETSGSVSSPRVLRFVWYNGWAFVSLECFLFFLIFDSKAHKRLNVENQAPLSPKCAFCKTNEKWGENKESLKYK